ncbi:MAG: tol-pal system-associated acyl-CoA thioesterase [Devosiaceae bacterium]|nr:tol-pal system-associated acyl-CoA thioesterase [Devosiaceae bacterium]
MAAHSFPIRIYYEDTDFSGNVYHAAYLKFMERARTEFLREREVHHSELLKTGMVFAVRSLEISYDRTAHIDDLLEVVTKVDVIKGARMVLAQSILRGGVMLTNAKVTIVAISLKGRPVRLPKAVSAALMV